MSGNGRVAVIDGVRTPFARAWTVYKDMSAADLARIATTELLSRAGVAPSDVDEAVFGIVGAPVEGPNLGREVVLRSGIPNATPAYTVQMYCASSGQAIASAACDITLGHARLAIAGGGESISAMRAVATRELTHLLQEASKAKGPADYLALVKKLVANPSALLPAAPGLTEPTTGLTMGDSAEIMAKENGITREAQDELALLSHQRAAAAVASGRLAAELVAVPIPPAYETIVETDTDVRSDSSLEKLAKLRPVFDKKHGTITAGNASPLTDGASAVLLASATRARELGLEPLGFIRSWAVAALDIQKEQLLLGPAYSAPLALERAGMTLADIDLVEMHEAFAAQVLSNLQKMASDKFAKEKLGRTQAMGAPELDKLNVNGGSIAIGHPFGATGARLVMTLLKELKRRDLSTGLVTICAAGGLGFSMVLTRD
ncbi:MAG: acetyl-CoA C-acyltransferase [Candidatus Schekmanbacteria bacterium]|nr:acetyl-CoA C-acyltransferase [Candidatus Schekmanbacteria bacterium]